MQMEQMETVSEHISYYTACMRACVMNEYLSICTTALKDLMLANTILHKLLLGELYHHIGF